MRISDCSSDVCSSDLLVIHSVLTGGQAQGDTMDGLASLLEHFPNVPVVVWLNEFFGRVERDGRKFEDSKLFRDHQEQIHALIRIPELRKETFGADVDQMLRQKINFAAVKEIGRASGRERVCQYVEIWVVAV